jgi:phenylacetate-coenzyme A ligase PaaK-like adenylate-forming protein
VEFKPDQHWSQYIHKINAGNFEDIALDLFRFQYRHNQIYQEFTNAIHIHPDEVQSIQAIPFLPVSFFKSHKVITGDHQEFPLVFESSGTTGAEVSRHYVADAGLYEEALLHGFRRFYGDPSGYAVLAVLPSYLERKNASLVQMAQVLMERSGHPSNGFFLNEWEQLDEVIQRLELDEQPTLLLGVTFALLDLAAAYPMQLSHTLVMETGGMKGRKEEWTRGQVHAYLQSRWGVNKIHSEYGMTELLSQAYAVEGGRFRPCPTMQIMVRDINDPLTTTTTGSGCLNIIDLANVHSCAFIATEDIGKIDEDGSFEVLGRMDHAALRGCSLLTA